MAISRRAARFPNRCLRNHSPFGLRGCAHAESGQEFWFSIKLGPALEVVTASGREEFVRVNLPNFVRILEKRIQEYPEEWEQWISF